MAQDFLAMRTLAGWGLMPVDAPSPGLTKGANVVVAKMSIRDDDPRQGITDHLRKHPTDLLVMATEGRTGLARMLNPLSVADTVSYLTNSHNADASAARPQLCRPSTGRTQPGACCACWTVTMICVRQVATRQWLPAFSGDADMQILWLQTTDTGAGQDICCRYLVRHGTRNGGSGEPTKTIIETAREFGADLLVLKCVAPLSPMARMRGNRNDRVLRELNIPLLSVPIP